MVKPKSRLASPATGINSSTVILTTKRERIVSEP